jgi:hypothetical protein
MTMEVEGGIAEMDEPQVMHVKVINRNDFVITDRFDGVPYTFHKDSHLAIPADAAHHIFGWHPEVDPAEMKRHTQKRFGWNTPAMDADGRADRFYSLLEIKPILYRMVPVEVDTEGMPASAADPFEPKRAPKVNRTMAAADTARV